MGGPACHGSAPSTSVEAGYAWLPHQGPTALVEMASASGLGRVPPGSLNPMRTTTYGTGELIRHATRRSPQRLWLAVGGSATVDGGVGAATALGWSFLDARGRDVGLGGEALERIARIVAPRTRAGPLPKSIPVEVLADVENPLLGPAGAARVFGPQKGATPDMVNRLEAGLANLADIVERDLGLDVRTLSGGGAAGGLGAGAVAFLDAQIVSGVDTIMDAVGLNEALKGATWVVTGEGSLDEQSLHGKAVSGIAKRARESGARTAVVAGRVDLDPDRVRRAGIDEVETCTSPGMALGQAFAEAPALIQAAAARLVERLARPRP